MRRPEIEAVTWTARAWHALLAGIAASHRGAANDPFRYIQVEAFLVRRMARGFGSSAARAGR